MTTKNIYIIIPEDKELSYEMHSFSPEENYLMLKVGSECLLEARKAVVGLTQTEMYNKLKEETKEDVKKLEIQCMVQKELGKHIEISMKNMYETQIANIKETFEMSMSNYENEKNQLRKSISVLNEKIRQYEEDSNSMLNTKLAIEREKWKDRERQLELMKEEYEKKAEKMRITYESIITSNNKSTSAKGSEGEMIFEKYAETFQDFKGFEFIDTHTKGGQGDFHLNFDEFVVLVDAKNYKKNVPSSQREKIKADLIKNEHIQFGWLVSLNTSIDKYDRSPIMYEWINTKQCLVYINNLSGFEDPTKILRIIWFTCKELSKMIQIVDTGYDMSELTELKEHKFMMLDKVKGLRKNVREANTALNTMRNIMQSVDEQLKELLGAETGEILDSKSSLFDSWWESNIELVKSDETTESITNIWFKYKQENKDVIKHFDVSVEKFKQYVKTKMPASALISRGKSVNSAFDIKGIKLKQLAVETEITSSLSMNVEK